MRESAERSNGTFRILAAGSALLVAALSQNVPVSSSAKNPPPQQEIYHLFFRHVNFLAGKATAAAASGKSDSGFANYYQAKIGLSESDHEALLRRAAACESDLAQADQASIKAIGSLRTQYAVPVSGAPADAVLSQIQRMQSERDALIIRHVAQLKSDMSTSGYGKLQTYLNTQFVKNVSTIAAHGGTDAQRARTLRSIVGSRGQ